MARLAEEGDVDGIGDVADALAVELGGELSPEIKTFIVDTARNIMVEGARDGGVVRGKKTEQARKDENRVGRNDPCPCKSGMKYKKCCMRKGREET